MDRADAAVRERLLTVGVRSGQGEPERRAVASSFGFHPHSAPVRFDDPSDQGQADPGALGRGVESLEDAENLLVIARIDALAVVADLEARQLSTIRDADLDTWGRRLAGELGRVVEKVLEHLQQADAIPSNLR